MTTALEQRVSELELRILRIEKQLAINDPSYRHLTGGREKMNNLSNSSLAVETADGSDDDKKAIERAQSLLAALVEERRVISYSAAYRHIVGPYNTWLNAVHSPEVIRLACKTTPRRVGNLTIRLDALIVGIQTRRPARGHFVNAAYSEVDWIQTFGTWPLLDK